MAVNLKKSHFSCVPNTPPFFLKKTMVEKFHKSEKNAIFHACRTGPIWCYGGNPSFSFLRRSFFIYFSPGGEQE